MNRSNYGRVAEGVVVGGGELRTQGVRMLPPVNCPEASHIELAFERPEAKMGTLVRVTRNRKDKR